jgi:hypothetical protein
VTDFFCSKRKKKGKSLRINSRNLIDYRIRFAAEQMTQEIDLTIKIIALLHDVSFRPAHILHLADERFRTRKKQRSNLVTVKGNARILGWVLALFFLDGDPAHLRKLVGIKHRFLQFVRQERNPLPRLTAPSPCNLSKLDNASCLCGQGWADKVR